MTRIGIDGRWLVLPGVGRYTRTLIDGLAQFQDQVDLLVYIHSDTAFHRNDMKFRRVNFSLFSIREQLSWASIIMEDRLDIFHAPHYVFPIFSAARVVVNLHDLVYYHFPFRRAQIFKRFYYRFMNRMAVRNADFIITGSNYSRLEAHRLLGASPDKIKVVPYSIDANFRPQSASACNQLRRKYGLPDEFLLNVGTNKPWKNRKTLLRVISNIGRSNSSIRLVLAGKKGQDEDRVEDYIHHFGLQDTVLDLGEIPDEELPALYSAAKIVLCPSLYEGFGLTAAEALACGVPVISSNAASLPEVVDQAAILIDPMDEAAWGSAIMALWTNPARQETLRQSGLERARFFQPETMGRRTLAIYQQVINTEGV